MAAVQRDGLRPAIGRFLAHLAEERRASPHTVSAYRRDLGTYQEGVQGNGIDQASQAPMAVNAAIVTKAARNAPARSATTPRTPLR